MNKPNSVGCVFVKCFADIIYDLCANEMTHNTFMRFSDVGEKLVKVGAENLTTAMVELRVALYQNYRAWNGRPDPLCNYNPITGEQMILPSGSKRLPSSYMVSLGFDSSTGKYKVVRKRGIRKGKEVSRFEIISLGESSWRELDVPMLDWQASSVVFCNGVFYCQMLNRISPNYWSIHILAIDVSDETFQVISFVDNFSRPRPYVDMMDLEGSLTLAEHDRHLMKIWRVTGNKVGDFSFESPTAI
ncbi:unnamed protein product [Ilex paraguariensis]|uniref:F-box associated beta-propeller type 3 domain-containing protein n=1 Tax=Ilex paraguariensis TaxID=185542 RepID=A0ABC8RSH0_9AQUA